MVRGKSFHAIWDQEAGLWSTDEYDVQRLVDKELNAYAEKRRDERPIVDDMPVVYKVQSMSNFSSRSWLHFRNYVGHLTDNSEMLDSTITFQNTEVRKEDYVSKRATYSLPELASIDAWDGLVGTLYDPEQRAKIEWAIGAILTGDARSIQKFLVLYGPPGAGKGTILGVVERLFDGYRSVFVAKDLTSGNSQFATAPFQGNPLVSIDYDGDLSRIADNTKLNSVVSHEPILINEKNKPAFVSEVISFLLISSNKAVKITDAKSGIIRRLIDVHPSGRRIPPRQYQTYMTQIEFELGDIALHCINVYREMGRDYYSAYKPVEMMLETNVFFNFIEDNYDSFEEQDGVTLSLAYSLYKDYCADALIDYRLTKLQFREELKNYFRDYHERFYLNDGTRVRSYYSGFRTDKFEAPVEEAPPLSLVLDQSTSILDDILKECPAQYSNDHGGPRLYWDDSPREIKGELRTPDPSQVVSTILSDIDTSKEHYVRPMDEQHIVIDFDLKDAFGQKSMEANLAEASKWPATYAEFSKGGAGIHLHYIYVGDVSELSRIFGPDIEVKVFTGNASLRRRLSLCNNVPIATISGGLPLKEKKMNESNKITSERGLRSLLERNFQKEFMHATKPSMDFMKKILDDAYDSGLEYDVSDLKQDTIVFANNSHNQSTYCLGLVGKMKWSGRINDSDAPLPKPVVESGLPDGSAFEKPIAFFDVEVFPNVWMLCYKRRNDDTVVRMINPSPDEVNAFVKSHRIIGFNNRRYDNHILYAAMNGYSISRIYELSCRIIANEKNVHFPSAYGLSYADIYDYASTKQSLKLWQIMLGITHIENHYPWDKPLPEEHWDEVAKYCENDVVSTEKTYEATEQDFIARQILADISGLAVNDKTNNHSARIILEGDREAKAHFVYTRLEKDFPGYTYNMGKSEYRGINPSEGGYVYEEVGSYENVAVLDVQSMHPNSAIQLDIFGKYTKNLKDLVDARVAIKLGDYEKAGTYFNGALKPYLKDPKQAKALSYALKIVINSVYGLTSAKHDNPFRDVRNIDNIVAKRGALFMIDLQLMVQELGYQVVHIKTDSIKIANADQFIIDTIMKFGEDYGYVFEHEDTYEKFCLVDKANYIAYNDGRWEATGIKFGHPYVMKMLFTKERIDYDDFKEAKSVGSKMYAYFADPDSPMALSKIIPELTVDDLSFIGKVGSFVAVNPDTPGAFTLVKEGSGKSPFVNVTGGSGVTWLEFDQFKARYSESEDHGGEYGEDVNTTEIDITFYNKLAENAIDEISKFEDFDQFVHKEVMVS